MSLLDVYQSASSVSAGEGQSCRTCDTGTHKSDACQILYHGLNSYDCVHHSEAPVATNA